MPRSRIPTLVLVGGFLGAGKTSLLVAAARILAQRGVRAAAITNDQDSGLVDTRYTEAHSLGTREVTGGCFCCRFSDLIEAADQLAAHDPEVILAEPVGSCIDLSATILQPLKRYHAEQFRLAPLTVLLDPGLAKRVFDGTAGEDVSYLFRQQLLEADLVCGTKADLYLEKPELPVPVDAWISARTGQGVEAWLTDVLSGKRVAGARTLEVDYDRYADAEAALAWVNLQADVNLRQAAGPAAVAGPLLEDLDRSLTAADAGIAHLKVFVQSASGYIKAGIVTNGGEPFPEGDLMADAVRRHELVVNLRATGDPQQLEGVVRQALGRMPGTVAIRHVSAFRPARPRPEHRISGFPNKF